MRKQKILFRRGAVLVTFNGNYTRETAETIFVFCGIRIKRWLGDSMTAEILVREGREYYWLRKVKKIPGVQGASLDTHL